MVKPIEKLDPEAVSCQIKLLRLCPETISGLFLIDIPFRYIDVVIAPRISEQAPCGDPVKAPFSIQRNGAPKFIAFKSPCRLGYLAVTAIFHFFDQKGKTFADFRTDCSGYNNPVRCVRCSSFQTEK